MIWLRPCHCSCAPGSCSRARMAWTCLAMRPYFHLPAFGIARALRAHRAIAMMTTKAFHALPPFGGVAFVIQVLALRTGDGVGGGIVMKVLRAVGIIVGGFPLGGGPGPALSFWGGAREGGAPAVPRVG